MFRIFLALFLSAATAFAQTDPNDEIAERLCEAVFGGHDYQYENIFAEEFRAAVPRKAFARITDDVIEAMGLCTWHSKEGMVGGMHRYKLWSSAGSYVTVHLSIIDISSLIT